MTPLARAVPRRYSDSSSRLWARTVFVVLLCALLLAPAALAKNGAFKSTLHGNAEKGPQRRADRGRGACSQCHLPHAAHNGSDDDAGLFAPNDNQLCFYCHSMQSEDGVFAGPGAWARSTHGSDPGVAGGGTEGEAKANRCANCHDPHGNKDRNGVIGAMLHVREPEACFSCHDGSRGSDILTETRRSFAHGQMSRGTHESREGGNAAAFASASRHVSCSDCHNVHRASADRLRPIAPDASERLAGVSRVQVTNGAPGTVPLYTFRSAEDTSPVLEYEICFKCHSSWTRLTGREADLAVLTNPSNPSFHPIQAPGKNRAIHPDAFVNGYDSTSQIRCTDCHGSDSPRVAGMHGSSNEHLLKAPVEAVSANVLQERSTLCFGCHAWKVYGDPSADVTRQRASRFSLSTVAGHTLHVGVQRLSCPACHESHGSTRHSALIGTGKGRPIVSFTESPTGGSCMTTCHSLKSYTLNYGR